ncbi:MAG: hypothetical protein V3V74_07425 [Nitrosomonadaceae bacterium]
MNDRNFFIVVIFGLILLCPTFYFMRTDFVANDAAPVVELGPVRSEPEGPKVTMPEQYAGDQLNIKEIAESGEYHDKLALRERFLVFPDSLYDLKMHQEYKLELFEGEFVEFTVVKREELDDDKYLMRGQIPNTKFGLVTMVFYGGKGIAGNVVVPGRKPFKIQHTRGGIHRVSERAMTKRKPPNKIYGVINEK